MPFLTAVLYNSRLDDAMQWVLQKYPILNIDKTNRRLTAEDGSIFILVSIPEHILGYEFDGYIKSPFYYTFEDEVKLRLKR